MTTITDKGMQAKPTSKTQWLSQPFSRGAGVFNGRITPTGERRFYFRYTDSKGERLYLLIGPYHPKGTSGLTVAQAYAKACELSERHRSGVKDLHVDIQKQKEEAQRAEQQQQVDLAEAAQKAELVAQRRITIRQLFDRWAKTELAPHARGDGKRAGRKDGGKYTEEQFTRRIFPTLGHIAAEDLRKSDVLAVIDAVKAEGKLRTCNVLLADLKQMLRFAVAREIIPHNPLETITKRDAGGSDVERDRVLSVDEIKALAEKLPNAGMGPRSVHAVWLFLSTGARVGELMTARWEHVDTEIKRWHLPQTKNQRTHTVHLSKFAAEHFSALLDLREIDKHGIPTPWVFPNAAGTSHVDIKTFGKQLADRQRGQTPRMEHRTKNTAALSLSGGKWTAHDLRRTAATLMASLDISTDVIDECLNHMLQSRVSRIYIRDRREAQQAIAFDALGEKLTKTLASEPETC